MEVADGAQRRQINLGINASALERLVPKMVADLFQRQALRQQVGSTSMPQHVGTVVRQGQTQCVQSVVDHASQGTIAQGAKRR